jgi:tyrosine-protein phosphatase SIW14
MSRPWQTTLGIVIVLGLIGGPAVLAVHQEAQTRNFRVVREDVLYRSGQMTRAGLKRVIHDYGIKTVITLRDAAAPGLPPPDRAEEEFCNGEEVNYVRIPPRSWDAPDGAAPADEGVQKFRAVLDDPRNYPVLVHCLAGIHRTGAYCAIYRMEYEHWTNERAIAEVRACGYSNLDDEWDILGYLEQYRPTWQGPEEPAASEAGASARRKPRRPGIKPGVKPNHGRS